MKEEEELEIFEAKLSERQTAPPGHCFANQKYVIFLSWYFEHLLKALFFFLITLIIYLFNIHDKY